MKARDSAALAALRSTVAAIANAEAVEATPTGHASAGPFAGAVDGLGAGEAPRRELTDTDVRMVVAREIADRRDAADTYDDLGQTQAASDLRAQAIALERYLTSA
jgi:uncharacterized protein YqeY